MITLNEIHQSGKESFSVEILFRKEKHPFLSDHLINGTCFFPAVIMLELMIEFGMALSKEKGVIIVDNFRILRPLKIIDARTVKLYARKNTAGIQISLCADYVKNGRTVRSDIVYAESVFSTGAYEENIDSKVYHDENIRCYSLRKKDLYFDDFMQSGPYFQGLGKDICFSETHLKGRVNKSDGDSSFLFDPFILDNCFQLGDISCKMYKEYAVLPVGIDHLVVFAKLSTDEAFCYGMLQGYEDQVAICNFVVCDASDRIIMYASGVRQHNFERARFDIMEYFQQFHVRTDS